jgi:hypothetical protein
MVRHRMLLTVLAVGAALSFASTLRADTKVIIAHRSPGIGIGIGTWIGRPVEPVLCHPPVHRHVVVSTPRRHRFVHIGPPVIVAPPPVVRHVVVEPPPVVTVRPPLPVEESRITVWVTNTNGSRTAVTLTRRSPWYVGPRGEYYSGIPTNEQLRVVYGF